MRILIFLFFSAFSANAQYLIKGTVLDASDKKPLPYAFVELQKENIGTVTNNDGYFEIKSAKKDAQLKIGLLGYESKLMDIAADQTPKDEIVYLTPRVFTLNEVIVAPEKIEELIKAIYNKHKEKKNDIYLADAFYRDYCTVDNFPVNASEIFYKVQLNQSGIGNWNFIQGRSAEAKMAVEKPSAYNSYSSLINNSKLVRGTSITEFTPSDITRSKISIFPINEDPGRYYTYKRIGEKTIDNKKVAVISFAPNKSYTNKFRFRGNLEVIEDDLQIIYLEVSLNKYQFLNKMVRHDAHHYIDSCYLKHIWHYRNLGKNWQLERIENSLKFHAMQAIRPGDYKDYKLNKKTKTYLKQVNCLTSTIYFFNHKPQQASELTKQAIKENDRKLIWENHYNPEFWVKNSKTLTEIPFERNIKESLIKNGFYGNLFQGSINFSKTYPQCSAIENRVIGELGYNYYHILRLFLTYYFYTMPEKELYTLFNNDIKPVYKAYIEKIGNHKVPENKLLKLESAINRIPYNKYPDVADILFVFKEIDPSASNSVLSKLRQYEKNYNRQ